MSEKKNPLFLIGKFMEENKGMHSLLSIANATGMSKSFVTKIIHGREDLFHASKDGRTKVYCRCDDEESVGVIADWKDAEWNKGKKEEEGTWEDVPNTVDMDSSSNNSRMLERLCVEVDLIKKALEKIYKEVSK